MLAVAQAKAEQNGLQIPFYLQNMAELEGFSEFDIIGIFCDSLNYLKTESEVKDTFMRAHAHLKRDGLFIFDVHSIYKIMQIFMNQTFAENDEEISYIWHSYQGEYPNSVEHDLSFLSWKKKPESMTAMTNFTSSVRILLINMKIGLENADLNC